MQGTQGGVVFRVGEELFYLPATVAQRVAPVPKIGRIPSAPPDLCGLALVDGEMIPIVALSGSRTAMLVVTYLGDRLGIVGVDIVATGRFETQHDHVLHEGEHARLFDVSAIVARVRDIRWVV
jgi:chemotaxis signal transduction protein